MKEEQKEILEIRQDSKMPKSAKQQNSEDNKSSKKNISLILWAV